MKNTLGTMQHGLDIINILIYGFKIVFFVLISFAMFFGAWKSKVKKYTREQMEQLMKAHKYIPDLFVEIGNTKDVFRFFVFGEKWRFKVVQTFNTIYANFYGNILQQKLLKSRFPNIKFKLKKSFSIKKILYYLNENTRFHQSFKPDVPEEPCFYKDDRVTEFWFEYHSFKYEEELKELKIKVNMMKERYLILIGNAGNGKTNLLCSLSELMSRNDIPNLFINAKDIPVESMTWFYDLLCILKVKNEYFHKVVLFLINLNLWVNRQYFFILVDAINENDSLDFDKTIKKFLHTLLQYSRIKILVSCRSEFFECKFKPLLENINRTKPFVYKLEQEQYNEETIDYLLEVYKKWFNFQGYISPLVRKKLTTQLLLMRIFFEIYQNTNTNIVSLQKSQIFRIYVENIQKNIAFNLSKILKKIIDKMIELSQYNGIPLDVCQLSDEELKDIKKIEDHSILFGKKIEIHKDTILQREITMLYFVYDELRDYLLSRNILESCLDKNYHIDIELVQKKIQSIYDSHSPIVEGVLKYSYSCFKSDLELSVEERKKLCCYILTICKPNHLSLGIEIILNTDSILDSFERDFIGEVLGLRPEEIVKLLVVFMISDRHGGSYKLKELLDILCKIDNRKSLFQIAVCLFRDNWSILWEKRLRDIDAGKHILTTYQKIMVLLSSILRNDLKYTDMTYHFLNLPEASIWLSELKRQMGLDL